MKEIYSNLRRTNNWMYIALLCWCICMIVFSYLIIKYQGHDFIPYLLLAIGSVGIFPTIYGIVRPKIATFFYIDPNIMFWLDNTTNAPVNIEYVENLSKIEIDRAGENTVVEFHRSNGKNIRIGFHFFGPLKDFEESIANSELAYLLKETAT